MNGNERERTGMHGKGMTRMVHDSDADDDEEVNQEESEGDASEGDASASEGDASASEGDASDT